jgi:hypothetical protein
VNLLIYLADQLLRGCQSADNQVQTLENQELRRQSSTNPAFCTRRIVLLLSCGSLADSSLFSFCFGL